MPERLTEVSFDSRFCEEPKFQGTLKYFFFFVFCPEMHTQKPQHGLKKLWFQDLIPQLVSPLGDDCPDSCPRPRCPSTARTHAPQQVWGSGLSAVGLQTSEYIGMSSPQGGLHNQYTNHMQQRQLATHAWAAHSGPPVQRVLCSFV